MIDYKEGDWVERIGGEDHVSMPRGSLHKVARIEGKDVYFVGRKNDDVFWYAPFFRQAKNKMIKDIINDL